MGAGAEVRQQNLRGRDARVCLELRLSLIQSKPFTGPDRLLSYWAALWTVGLPGPRVTQDLAIVTQKLGIEVLFPKK